MKNGPEPSNEHLVSEHLESDWSPFQDPETNRNFWCYDFDIDEYYEIESTLLAAGEYCLFYMQDSMISQIGVTQAQSICESYKDEFDTLIYPTVVDLTGNPNGTLGDIDGDPRIVILINDNFVNYYSQRNEIVAQYSNQCEMIYIYYPSYLILNTITHEFCHLIWFNYEFDEVHFLLEGLAEFATYQCGYLEPFSNRSSRTIHFLNNPNDSLVYFDVAGKDYGGSYLFTFYLAEQFGIEFLSDLVQHNDDGAYGIETALEDAGYNISFNQLYLDWITALTINELGFADNKYGYINLDVTIEDISVVDNLPFNVETMDVWCYGSNIFELADPGNGFTIETSSPSTGKTGVSIVFHDVEGWHVSQTISSDQIEQNIIGTGIDSAFIIVTYYYSSTPAGGIDFGEGMSEEIEFSITDYIPPTNPDVTNTTTTDTNKLNFVLLLTIGGGSIGLSVLVLILYSKKRS